MKNEDKKIYIVRGSEDGNLGVFSNLKRAYEVAIQYGNWDTTNKYKSYSKVCKEFKEHEDGWRWTVCVIEESYSGNATIEKHYLNNTN
jgi:hypothetical protein